MLSLITGDVMKKILLGLSITLITLPVMADDLGSLLQCGYKIIGRSTINESFMGCEWNKTFSLANGQYFMCEETKNNMPDPRKGYSIRQKDIATNNAGRIGFMLAGGDPSLLPTAQDIAQQQYEAQIASQYGVPYKQVIQIYNQQKTNSYNLPLLILQNQYGTTKFVINGTEYRGKLF